MVYSSVLRRITSYVPTLVSKPIAFIPSDTEIWGKCGDPTGNAIRLGHPQ